MTETFQISLKAARVNAGMTQKDVASLLGISNQTVIKWEKTPGVVPGERMAQLASIYGLSVDRILFYTRQLDKSK